MASKRITDQIVRDLAIPPPSKQAIIRDNSVGGFAVRKTATGCTAFIFNYAVNGRERRCTIGQYPAWSVQAAREEAKRLRRMVDVGDDPLELRTTARHEPTLSQFWQTYQRDILPRKARSTQVNEKGYWERLILPTLGSKKLSQVRTGDIDRLHNSISIKTPVQANRCIATLRHAYAMAIRWQIVSFNPVAGVRQNPENGRERYLSDEERRRLLQTLTTLDETTETLVVLFLLLTGARSGEVFRATWDQFDITAGIWVKPSSHTKQRRVHRIPLSAAAIDVLKTADRFRVNELVFPNRAGHRLCSIKRTFNVIRRDAKLLDFRVHDLRHSFASFLASDGASLQMIGKLLGHTQVATTNRYSHMEDQPLRDATERVGRRVVGHGT